MREITNHNHFTVGTSATEPKYPATTIATSDPMTAAMTTGSSLARRPRLRIISGVVTPHSMKLKHSVIRSLQMSRGSARKKVFNSPNVEELPTSHDSLPSHSYKTVVRTTFAHSGTHM